MTKPVMPIRDKVQAYCEDMAGEHDRYRSWEHCYRYFRLHAPDRLNSDRNHAALQLGFYLASWGMYRGSSFLLQYTYTAHLGVIDQLIAPQLACLWQHEFGPTESGLELFPAVTEAISAIREAYRPFAPASEARQASDTLVTKVLLGTIGCLPACDRYFIEGFKGAGFKYAYLNAAFIERLLTFCSEHLADLHAEQCALEKVAGFRYPLMKVVDMYFWQIGYELAGKKTKPPPEGII